MLELIMFWYGLLGTSFILLTSRILFLRTPEKNEKVKTRKVLEKYKKHFSFLGITIFSILIGYVLACYFY